MALIETVAKDSGHWYDQEGNPAYEIVGANGKQRPTTLRDARKLNLFPSVTMIIRCAAAPGLENWKIDQGILAALTLPRREGEPESAWLSRVKEDSKEQARRAAERGAAVHTAIERHIDGVPPKPEFFKHAVAAVRKLHEWGGKDGWSPERPFANPLGFGGKVDAHKDGFVADYKTKEFTQEDLDGGKKLAWDEQAIQLAAYRIGLGMPKARCANIYSSMTEPGLAVLIEWTDEDLQRGWEMFKALLDYWKAKNRFQV